MEKKILLEKLTISQLVKKFPAFLWNPNVHYQINKPHLVRILSRFYLVSAPIPFLKIHFNIILISTPTSLKWFLSFKCPHQNPVFTSPFRHFDIDTLFPHSWWSVCRGTWLYRTSIAYVLPCISKPDAVCNCCWCHHLPTVSCYPVIFHFVLCIYCFSTTVPASVDFSAWNTARSCHFPRLHQTLYSQDACLLSIQTYHHHNTDSRSQNDGKETKIPTGNRTLLTHYVASHSTFQTMHIY
jgi:hypothetical protein